MYAFYESRGKLLCFVCSFALTYWFNFAFCLVLMRFYRNDSIFSSVFPPLESVWQSSAYNYYLLSFLYTYISYDCYLKCVWRLLLAEIPFYCVDITRETDTIEWQKTRYKETNERKNIASKSSSAFFLWLKKCVCELCTIGIHQQLGHVPIEEREETKNTTNKSTVILEYSNRIQKKDYYLRPSLSVKSNRNRQF